MSNTDIEATAGLDGGASSFGSHLTALGGAGGAKGRWNYPSSNLGGARILFPFETEDYGLNSNGGASASSTLAGKNGGDSIYGPGAGGGGGSRAKSTDGGAIQAAGKGGAGMASSLSSSEWANGFNSSRTQVEANGVTWYGGGGGNYSNDGGDGGANGGGGGGGGAYKGLQAGNGGRGGNGIVIVYTYS